jgi:hypothetical protein
MFFCRKLSGAMAARNVERDFPTSTKAARRSRRGVVPPRRGVMTDWITSFTWATLVKPKNATTMRTMGTMMSVASWPAPCPAQDLHSRSVASRKYPAEQTPHKGPV